MTQNLNKSKILAKKIGLQGVIDTDTPFKNVLKARHGVARRCSVKMVFLEIWQNSQESTCARVSFLIKLQACNLIEKETLAHVFPYKFLQNFEEHLFLQNTSGGCFWS